MKKNIIRLMLAFVSVLTGIETNAQSTTNNTWPGGTTHYLGWSSPHDIDFKINGSQHMIIDGTSNVGFVGIGTTSPSEKIQVVGGNIDINSDDKAYMIARYPVLWYNQDYSNIYVGKGAGITDGGNNNTFTGYNAGNANTDGEQNTFILPLLVFSSHFAEQVIISNKICGPHQQQYLNMRIL